MIPVGDFENHFYLINLCFHIDVSTVVVVVPQWRRSNGAQVQTHGRVRTSTYIESGRGEEDVYGLCDIRSVEAVVVRYVSMVMVLQGHHVSDKGVNWNSKSLQ